jgi:hypothetical protein
MTSWEADVSSLLELTEKRKWLSYESHRKEKVVVLWSGDSQVVWAQAIPRGHQGDSLDNSEAEWIERNTISVFGT